MNGWFSSQSYLTKQTPRSQWLSQIEAEEATAPETNFLRFLLVLCINFQLLERRQKPTTSLTGPPE